MVEGQSPAGPASDVDDEVYAGISETARTLFAAGDTRATLDRLTALAIAGIDGCDHAGVFVVKDGRVTAPAATGPVAVELDALQRRLGEGPCLDAITDGGVVYAGDLTDPTPWAVWAPAAVQVGVRSSFSVALQADGQRGALNCYGELPHAFGTLDRGKATVLATLAGLALGAADDKQQSLLRASNLEAALVARELIGQAQGIVMARERITAEQAFDVLRRASQHLNIKLREVAQDVVDTGEVPTTRGPKG